MSSRRRLIVAAAATAVLVPAAVAVLGDRFWWPGNPRRGEHAAEPSHREEPVAPV